MRNSDTGVIRGDASHIDKIGNFAKVLQRKLDIPHVSMPPFGHILVYAILLVLRPVCPFSRKCLDQVNFFYVP